MCATPVYTLCVLMYTLLGHGCMYCMHMCICVRVCVCVCVDVYEFLCVCMSVCIYACMPGHKYVHSFSKKS